jgi:hypothetical protein
MNNHAHIVAVFFGLASACSPANAERLVLASASYGKNVIAICDTRGQVLWSHSTAGPRTGHAGHHDIQFLDNGNLLFHEDWTTVVEMTLDNKAVWKYDSSTMNGNQGPAVTVLIAERRFTNFIVGLLAIRLIGLTASPALGGAIRPMCLPLAHTFCLQAL